MTAAVRLLMLALAVALSGCAMFKRKAVGMVADTLASSGDVFTRDDDLELVGQAIPFGLKLYESLLDSSPKNRTCSSPRAATSPSTAWPSSRPMRWCSARRRTTTRWRA
jgi:hypothetical protein